MTKPPLSHYSPVFANKPWAEDAHYTSYFYKRGSNEISAEQKGQRQWGRKRGLYTWDVENSLSKNLENDASSAYRKLSECKDLSGDERVTWAQFLLSQHARTPTFLRYENALSGLLGDNKKPTNDRVGCRQCGDLAYLTEKDWRLLLAHKDDYFIRSDNPVLLTGFIERHQTSLFYPLSPTLCFAAYPKPNDQARLPAETVNARPTMAHELEKGGTWLINFHLARSAKESVILSPSHETATASAMFDDILGLYPQPPFGLYWSPGGNYDYAFENVRMLMSLTDQTQYPHWLPHELEINE